MKVLFLSLICLLQIIPSPGQQEKMEVEGAIQISNSQDPTPDPGTIRWTGTDFEGWNGVIWVSLSGNKTVGTVTDIDGNIYKTIRINSYEWMTENLRVTRYRDGTVIDQIINNATWGSTTTGAWCWYQNDDSYEIPYGKLYNYYAVQSDKLCPQGWFVPRSEHVGDIIKMDAKIVSVFGFMEFYSIGGQFKDTGTTHWNSPNTGATNSTGFTGLPGGYRRAAGTFRNRGARGTWWIYNFFTSDDKAEVFYIENDHSSFYVSSDGFNGGFSVRCFRIGDP